MWFLVIDKGQLGLIKSSLAYNGDDEAVVHLNLTEVRSICHDLMVALISTKDDFCFQLFGDEESQRGLACADLDYK